MPHFDALTIYSCGKHCEKGRNCLEQAIIPFLTMFSTLYGTYFSFQMHFKLLSAICFNLYQFKILSSGNELTHYQMTNFRLIQSERVADDNFKLDKNGRKLSKRVENTVGKGEIARYEQFLLLPKCFQKACFPGASKGVIVWECVNSLPHNSILH